MEVVLQASTRVAGHQPFDKILVFHSEGFSEVEEQLRVAVLQQYLVATYLVGSAVGSDLHHRLRPSPFQVARDHHLKPPRPQSIFWWPKSWRWTGRPTCQRSRNHPERRHTA